MRKQDFPQDVQAYLKSYYLKTWGSFLGLALVFGLILFFFGEQIFSDLLHWQRVLIYSLVMLSTVFISRLPKHLANRTYYGTVEKVHVRTTYTDHNWRTFWEPPTENHVMLWIRTPKGKLVRRTASTFSVQYRSKTNENNRADANVDTFQVGDKVLHLAGASHTVVLPKLSDDHVVCAVCGQSNPIAQSACADCGYTLIKE